MALIKNNLTKPLCFLTPLMLGNDRCWPSKQTQEAYQNQQKQTKEVKKEMGRFCDQFARPFTLVKEKFRNKYSAIAAKAEQGESAIMQLKLSNLKCVEALGAIGKDPKSMIEDTKNILATSLESCNKYLQLLQSLVELLSPIKDTFKKERIVITAAESLENYLEQIVKFIETNKQYGTALKELMEKQKAKTGAFKEIMKDIAVQVQPIQEEYERKLMEIPLKEKDDLSFELAASLFRAIAEVDKTVGAEEIAQAFIDAEKESKQTGDKLQKQVNAIITTFQTYSIEN